MKNETDNTILERLEPYETVVRNYMETYRVINVPESLTINLGGWKSVPFYLSEMLEYYVLYNFRAAAADLIMHMVITCNLSLSVADLNRVWKAIYKTYKRHLTNVDRGFSDYGEVRDEIAESFKEFVNNNIEPKETNE